MIVDSGTGWLLEERYAPAMRYMQDPPLCHVADIAYAAPYAKRVAAWVHQLKKMTDKQLDAVNGIIEKRGWIEPPRWRPFAAVEERYHLSKVEVRTRL
ncbi:hypothetical protein V1294_006061 [Bradyrhizobium sp. AZCC 1678]|uniref:hypothetical protein n=1 Tax=Bradyrhizobium sp. AZCC 1678 TaxID=3117030 RepID=UPI002FF41F5C